LTLFASAQWPGSQANALPSPLYTAHVRTTFTVVLAGLLVSPATVVVAVKGAAASGLTTSGMSTLLPGAMTPNSQLTVCPVALQPGGPLTNCRPGGSTSTTVTLGVGASPVLLTVMV
jgi:hypothetical protein